MSSDPKPPRPAVPRPRARPPAKPVRVEVPEAAEPADLEVEVSAPESVEPRSGPPPLPRPFPLQDLVLRDPPSSRRRSPPPLPRTSPVPAALPYADVPSERTPRPTTLAPDPEPPKRRRRSGPAIALAVVASAIAGVTLHPVGKRSIASVVAVLAPPPAAPTASQAPATPEGEVSAKSAGVAREARNEAPAGIAAVLSRQSTEIPASSVTAPNCQQMLGTSFVEKHDPTTAATETQVGHRALVRGDMDAAQAAFCKAALWDGGTLERRLNLANLFLLRRDGKQAVEAAARALELDPKNRRALEFQADAWARVGNLAEARRAYLAVEQRPGSDADAAQWLVRRELDAAQRSLKAHDYARAEKLFLRVVVFEPEHEVATSGIATCLGKLNDPVGAEAWTRRAKELADVAGK